MVQVSMDSSLASRIPGLKLGRLIYENLVVSESPKLFRGRVNLLAEHIRIDHESRDHSEIPHIQLWRNTFKQLGMSPNDRPSFEGIYHHVLQNQPLPWVNSVVDVNHFCAMNFALPFSIYDADALHGNVLCRLGSGEETFEALSGHSFSLAGKILTADNQGPFGSPIADSQRAKVTEQTQRALQIIYIPPGYTKSAERLLGSTAKMVTHINGGTLADQSLIEADSFG